MKYKVNQNCIGCGLCTTTCPNVFTMSVENVAEAINEEVNMGLVDLCNEALESCPVGAIEREE